MAVSLTLALLIPVQAAPARPAMAGPSGPWPPPLPGVDGTVMLSDRGFLRIPREVRQRLSEPGAEPFDVARRAPTVDLAFHRELPHDGRNRTGWTTWGDIAVAADGRVYSGIGDHGDDAAGTANAYIYQWDPETRELRQVVDVNRVGPREGGEPGWSKVHARIDAADDGWIYFSGTLNNGQRAGAADYRWTASLPGGQLLRHHPDSGRSEVFASLPPARATATSLLDRHHNRWWCNLEAGDGNALWAIDLETGEPVMQSDDGVVTENRNFMLAADGSVIFNGEGGFWRADPRTGGVARTRSALPDHGNVRASTRESADGHIYGITYRPGRLFRYHPGRDELRMLGNDFLLGDYTPVIALSPDERFLYYMPGAHGQARTIGTPVVQYHIASGRRKVLAFLRDPIESRHDYVPAGTYGLKVSADGRTLYTCINGHPGDDHRPEHLSPNGFGLTAFLAIHIPERELEDPEQ